MKHDSEARALGGLDDLERRLRGPRIEEGSPAAELAVSILLPGLPALRRAPVLGVILLVAGVALPIALVVWIYINRADLIGFALDERFLRVVVALGLLSVLARFAAVAEIAHAHRRTPGIGARTAVATVVVLALSAPVLWVTYRANEARQVVADVFAGGSSAPLFVPDSSDGVASDEVTNILLFGGDAGPGRWGMRTDTMILVTVHEASGRTSLVSIPRNLTRLRFPPGTPLAEAFPDGYDDLANAVFTEVNTRPELLEYYGADGLQPEAVALAGAIGYSLDVEIDDFALVNMQGFTEVVDAVGGVSLDVGRTVPLPPSLPGERPLPSSVGPGLIEMDGALAIAYVRSRTADSDYERMGRQRQLLAALGSQVSATEALAAFGSVTGVLDDSMRSSLSSGEFSSLLDALGDNSSIHESVGLAPPLIDPGSPDYDLIRAIVDAVESGVITGQPSGYAS